MAAAVADRAHREIKIGYTSHEALSARNADNSCVMTARATNDHYRRTERSGLLYISRAAFGAHGFVAVRSGSLRFALYSFGTPSVSFWRGLFRLLNLLLSEESLNDVHLRHPILKPFTPP